MPHDFIVIGLPCIRKYKLVDKFAYIFMELLNYKTLGLSLHPIKYRRSKLTPTYFLKENKMQRLQSALTP